MRDPQFCEFATSLEALLNQLDRALDPQLLDALRQCMAELLRMLQVQADTINQHADTISQLQLEMAMLKEKMARGKEQWARAKEMARVGEEVAKLEEQLASNRRGTLLGQPACVFDKVAREYVFGPNSDFMTLVDLDGYYQYQDLLPEEAARYEKFCDFMMGKGCSVARLIRLLAPLREARREPARGYTEELESVTAEHLQQWAGDFYVPKRNVVAILPLLQLFTLPGKPLVPRPDASQVIG